MGKRWIQIHRDATRAGGHAIHVGAEAHVAEARGVTLEVIADVIDGEHLEVEVLPADGVVGAVLRIEDGIIEEELIGEGRAPHGDAGIGAFGPDFEHAVIPEESRLGLGWIESIRR